MRLISALIPAIGLAIVSSSAQAAEPRALEPVLTISAEQAQQLFNTDTRQEEVIFLNPAVAVELLGDDADMAIFDLNNLPTTAAGGGIHYIDAESAAQLLGDESR